MRALLLALLGCNPPVRPDAGTDLWRLGPPEPSVGVYGIAVDAGRGVVFATNLHVPFLTRVDAATGERRPSFDLRPALGDRYTGFPYVAYDPARDRLWVNDASGGAMVALDPEDGSPIATVATGASAKHFAVDEAGGVWVADPIAGEIVHVDGDEVVARYAADAPELIAVGDGRVAGLRRQPAVATVVDVGTGEVRAEGVGGYAGFPAVTADALWVPERVEGLLRRVDDDGVATFAQGSDPVSATWVPAIGLVSVDRQGAALPASGAYEGAPARVVARSGDGEVAWIAEVGKTAHFVAWDHVRGRLWTANEDSLDLSALSTEGVEVLRTGKLGLTLDDLAFWGSLVLVPSHLTDTVEVVDRDSGARVSIATSGWPLAIAVDADAAIAYVTCQDRAVVDVIDLASLTVTETLGLGLDTHQEACDPLCDAHASFTDIAWDAGRLHVTSGPEALLVTVELGAGVEVVSLPRAPGPRGPLHHMNVAVEDGRVVVFDPVGGSVHAVEDGAVVASAEGAAVDAAGFVRDGERLWLGATAYDRDLTEVASLEVGGVVAATDEVLVAAREDAVLTLDPGTLEVIAEVALAELRSPPYYLEGPRTPFDYAIDPEDGDLLLINVFAGTIEERGLPGLEAR